MRISSDLRRSKPRNKVIWDLYDAVGPSGTLFALKTALTQAQFDAGSSALDLDFDVDEWFRKQSKSAAVGRFRSQSCLEEKKKARSSALLRPSKSADLFDISSHDDDEYSESSGPFENLNEETESLGQKETASSPTPRKSPSSPVNIPCSRLSLPMAMLKGSSTSPKRPHNYRLVSKKQVSKNNSKRHSQEVESLKKPNSAPSPRLKTYSDSPNRSPRSSSSTTSSSSTAEPSPRDNIKIRKISNESKSHRFRFLKSSKEGKEGVQAMRTTLLVRAIYYGSLDMVVALLEAGAGVHPFLIHSICMLGSIEVEEKLKLILEISGQEFVNIQDHLGLTPLHYLMIRLEDRPKLVSKLLPLILEAGGSPNAKDKNGNSAMYFFLKQVEAKRDNMFNIFLILLPHIDPTTEYEPGRKLKSFFWSDVPDFFQVRLAIDKVFHIDMQQ